MYNKLLPEERRCNDSCYMGAMSYKQFAVNHPISKLCPLHVHYATGDTFHDRIINPVVFCIFCFTCKLNVSGIGKLHDEKIHLSPWAPGGVLKGVNCVTIALSV